MSKETIDKNNLPNHIAIIMDGNGRWANIRRLPRIAGHREGVRTVRKITEICGELGIRTLTLYTFSSENWNRPVAEIGALINLLANSLRKEVNDLINNNIRFTVIGDIKKFNPQIQNEILDAFHKTKNKMYSKGSIEYSFSHFDLEIEVFFIKVKKNILKDQKWIKKSNINKSSFPTVMKKIIEVAL